MVKKSELIYDTLIKENLWGFYFNIMFIDIEMESRLRIYEMLWMGVCASRFDSLRFTSLRCWESRLRTCEMSGCASLFELQNIFRLFNPEGVTLF